MATDTAFAVALIAMMGARVPVELRIFLTAAAIVDDIGAIVVVALFYSGELHPATSRRPRSIVGLLALLNRWRVYSVTPYSLLGIALWFTVHEAGLHATLAGVLLALFIPTRPPANLPALVAQANAILNAEARRSGEVLHAGPSLPALRALDAIHDRLESPADRLLRHAGARSSYLVLPVFALANAGVALTPGGGRGARGADARDRRRARGRQAARARRALGARGAARAGGEARRLFLAAARRRGMRSRASASPCRCSSPGRPSPIRATSRRRSSRCSAPRSSRRSSGVGVLWRAPAPEERHAEAPAGSPA